MTSPHHARPAKYTGRHRRRPAWLILLTTSTVLGAFLGGAAWLAAFQVM
jgi:hypothetical protein